jgi:hypothetical protein
MLEKQAFQFRASGDVYFANAPNAAKNGDQCSTLFGNKHYGTSDRQLFVRAQKPVMLSLPILNCGQQIWGAQFVFMFQVPLVFEALGFFFQKLLTHMS